MGSGFFQTWPRFFRNLGKVQKRWRSVFEERALDFSKTLDKFLNVFGQVFKKVGQVLKISDKFSKTWRSKKVFEAAKTGR